MTLTINLTGDVVGTNNGNVVISINSSGPFTMAPSILQWNSGVTSPTLTQASTTNTIGQNLTIQAQSTTNSGATAGNLNLAGGTASTTAGTGDVNIQGGSPTTLVNIVTFNATDFDNDGLVETMGIGSTLVSPRIYQITGTSTGNNLTIQAQNAAGTNKNGGSLILQGGTATGTGTTGGIVPSVQVRTNTSNSTYTIDSTGGGSDYHILHNNTGTVSYVMPAPTAGRELFLRDITGAVNTTNVFLVPHAAEKFNTSTGYIMSGTFSITNGSTSVTANTTQAGILAAGMSIVFGTDTKSYIVSAFNGTTGITLASSYTGTTNTVATGTINSLTFAANYGVLRIVSDGTNWYAKGDGTLTIISYNANGTWISPQGVTSVTATGFGGGGSGGSGGSNTTQASGGGGGGGSLQSTITVSITPSTAYLVNIGIGGSTVAAVTNSAGAVGQVGGDTTFGNSLLIFPGASGGGAGTITGGTMVSGGLCNKSVTASNAYGAVNFGGPISATGSTGVGTGVGAPAGGGSSSLTTVGGNGNANIANNGAYFPGTGGNAGGSSQSGGGGGGGQGPGGSGGNGGAGSVSTSATSGSSAANNSGAGGGGGGGARNSAQASGAGGAGGSGFLSISYSL